MRLIDADELILHLMDWHLQESPGWEGLKGDKVVCQTISRIIDVIHKEPEAKARWMRTGAFPHRVYCSNCYATYVPNDRWQIWTDKPGDGGIPRNYCPNCGAKMEVE